MPFVSTLPSGHTGPAPNSPLVSVLMCVKNAESTIGEALQSVRAQTYQPTELVVVDGASTDGTKGIIAQFASSVDRLISEPDSGYYDALNKAIGLAKGEFLLVANGDDILVPQAVERLVAFAIHSGADITAAHAKTIDAQGRFTGSLTSFWNASARLRCPLRHGAMLVSRRTYTRVGFYDASKKVIADWLWMQKAMMLGASVAILHQHLVSFRTTGMSSSSSLVHRDEINSCLTELEPDLDVKLRRRLVAEGALRQRSIVTLCRNFPLNGPLRQAVLASKATKQAATGGPEVTAVIPLNRDFKTAQALIDLLRQQTFSNYEVVVCGALSPKNRELLKLLAEDDLRIVYVRSTEDTAMQQALLHAIGDYLIVPTLKSLQDPTMLGGLLLMAKNKHAALITFTAENIRAISCERHDFCYSLGWWPQLFLQKHPSLTGGSTLFARDVYKLSIEWLAYWNISEQRRAFHLASFAVAAFSMFPTQVKAPTLTAVSLRINTLADTLEAANSKVLEKSNLPTSFAPLLIKAATDLFTQSISCNHAIPQRLRNDLMKAWMHATSELAAAHGIADNC